MSPKASNRLFWSFTIAFNLVTWSFLIVTLNAEAQDSPRPRPPIGAETQAELDAVTGASRGKSKEPEKNKASRERARKQWKRATGHNPEDVGC